MKNNRNISNDFEKLCSRSSKRSLRPRNYEIEVGRSSRLQKSRNFENGNKVNEIKKVNGISTTLDIVKNALGNWN